MASESELDQAIEAYRKARQVERRRSAAGTIGAVQSVLGGADPMEALTRAQAYDAAQRGVSVGGREGFSAQDRLAANLKIAEISGQLESEFAKVEAARQAGQAERTEGLIGLLKSLATTIGSTAGTGAQAYAQTLNKQADTLLELDKVNQDLNIDLSYLSGGFDAQLVTNELAELDRVMTPAVTGMSDTVASVLANPAVMDQLQRSLAEIGNRHGEKGVVTYLNQIKATRGLDVMDLLTLTPDRIASEPSLAAVSDRVTALNTLLNTHAKNAFQSAQDALRKKELITKATERATGMKMSGTFGTVKWLKAEYDKIKKLVDQAQEGDGADAAPGIEGVDAAKDLLANMPPPQAPITDAEDAKRRIMGTRKFQEEAAAAGLNPEVYFQQRVMALGKAKRKAPKGVPPQGPPAAPGPLPGDVTTVTGTDLDQLARRRWYTGAPEQTGTGQ